MKICLVDTSNLLYHCYYQNSKNSIDIFQKMLETVKHKTASNQLFFALDSNCFFRKKLYPPYKANRVKKTQEIQALFDYAVIYLQNQKYKMYKKQGYEADDVIATLAAKDKENEFIIVSKDRDFLQLLSAKISIYDFALDIFLYESFLEEKYNLKPKQYTDFLALSGDKSDNIKGANGVGKKSALKLIKKYGSVENVYTNIHLISNTKIKNALLDCKNEVFLCKKIIRLRNYLPLDIF